MRELTVVVAVPVVVGLPAVVVPLVDVDVASVESSGCGGGTVAGAGRCCLRGTYRGGFQY